MAVIVANPKTENGYGLFPPGGKFMHFCIIFSKLQTHYYVPRAHDGVLSSHYGRAMSRFFLCVCIIMI